MSVSSLSSKKKNILFKISGSVAAYKVCDVISKLTQDGHSVQTVVSQSALQFLGPATLEGLTGHAVLSDTFAAGKMMDHIHEVRKADLVILAPATANKINQLSHGLGEDLISTMFLAHDFQKPYLLAPAMNHSMYNHPMTQKSLATLEGLGVSMIAPESGSLACGETGDGRLASPERLYSQIIQCISKIPQGQVLVTYGGTEEPIDGVRSLGNFSTGSTGAFLCDQLVKSGFNVTAIHAKKAVNSLLRHKAINFQSFDDLEKALTVELQSRHYDAVIHLAAVSDYSVEAILNADGNSFRQGQGKLRSVDKLNIQLKTNKKLIHEIKKNSLNKNIKLIGFKLTNQADETERNRAVDKLFRLGDVDFVVQNDLTEINSSENKHIFRVFHHGQLIQQGQSKTELSQKITQLLSHKEAEL